MKNLACENITDNKNLTRKKNKKLLSIFYFAINIKTINVWHWLINLSRKENTEKKDNEKEKKKRDDWNMRWENNENEEKR